MTEETDDLQINNLPNLLTIFRMGLIPVVISCLYFSNTESELFEGSNSLLGWTAGWIFAIASITDFFDGYIARKKNIVTVFGSFLDPIADKFLTVSSLIMLQALERLPAVIVIVLVLREMYMTSLRLLALNEGVRVPVNQIGKWKTAIAMIGIPLLMANENWQGIPLPLMGNVLIYIACILSLWSAFHYTFNMIASLKKKRLLNKSKAKRSQGHEVKANSH